MLDKPEMSKNKRISARVNTSIFNSLNGDVFHKRFTKYGPKYVDRMNRFCMAIRCVTEGVASRGNQLFWIFNRQGCTSFDHGV